MSFARFIFSLVTIIAINAVLLLSFPGTSAPSLELCAIFALAIALSSARKGDEG